MMQGATDVNALGMLPDTLKIELALHVNLETLRKVSIFQMVQPEFLYDLVLKMRSYIFTPGDLICRKGEIAREMFIINHGILEVVSEDGNIIATLRAGDFFGEVGVLNIATTTNKRMADVRSVGYSEVFSLSGEDVLQAMEYFPEAKDLMIRYGMKRLKDANLVDKDAKTPVISEKRESSHGKREKQHGCFSKEASFGKSLNSDGMGNESGNNDNYIINTINEQKEPVMSSPTVRSKNLVRLPQFGHF